MRLLLSVLGVFTAVVYIEKPAEAEQNYPWCINKPDTPPQCRYTTLEQCLADRLGKGGSCSPNPYPSSPEPPTTRPRAAKACCNSSGSFAIFAAIRANILRHASDGRASNFYFARA
jgi:Protein of unknown function (DUF3551)